MFSKLVDKISKNISKNTIVMTTMFVLVGTMVALINVDVVYAQKKIIICNEGEYYNGTENCSVCPAGYYCPGGTYDSEKLYLSDEGKYKCPTGTMSDKGSSSEDSCYAITTCNSGEYYKGSGQCAICPAGYYCSGGNFKTELESSDGMIKCPGESSSVEGSNSLSACQVTCGKGEYYVGQGICNTCPKGYYCPNAKTFYIGQSYLNSDGRTACPNDQSSLKGSLSASDCYVVNEVCKNPDILKVIYFFLLIVDIVKIIIPIALIIFGLIDFSKAMISSDESAQKKSGKLFLKRLLYAVLVFIVPWLIEVIMVTLGNVLGEPGTTNFTDCIENANGDKIAELEEIENESKEEEETGFKAKCYECNGSSLRVWSVGEPSKDNCGGGWHIRNDLNRDSCNVATGACYYCTGVPDYEWSQGTPSKTCTGGTWSKVDKTQGDCQ